MKRWGILDGVGGWHGWFSFDQAQAANKEAAMFLGGRAVLFSDEAQERVVEKAISIPPPVSALARAIFNTDERVRRDVGAHGCEVGPCDVAINDMTRPYFQRAWDKNINGWRSEAEARAAAILGVLGK